MDKHYSIEDTIAYLEARLCDINRDRKITESAIVYLKEQLNKLEKTA